VRSQGAEEPAATRTSLLLERFAASGATPTRVLVDSGPDVRAQLLTAGIATVDGVVYTHAHADHTQASTISRAHTRDVTSTPTTRRQRILKRRSPMLYDGAAGSIPPILKAPYRCGHAVYHGGPGGELR